jgi:hypothetical protein
MKGHEYRHFRFFIAQFIMADAISVNERVAVEWDTGVCLG